jgi:dCMP deaminase
VGAIIIDERGVILATGYNGTPRGWPHCTPTEPCQGANDPPGDSRRCRAVHAEQNALLQCHRLDLAHTMFVSVAPCYTCAKMIMNTNIHRVIVTGPYFGDDLGSAILISEGKLYHYDYESTDVKLIQ